MITATEPAISGYLNSAEAHLAETARRVLSGERLGMEDGIRLLETERDCLLMLFHYADRIRRRYRGDAIRLCSIINARSGACSEDCSFCAQSARHHGADAPVYPLVDLKTIKHAAELASKDGATEFGIVTSGWGVTNEKELDALGDAIETVKDMSEVNAHASLGILNESQLRALKERGLTCLNHNLETAEDYYDKVCTTHSYQDRIDTLRAAKRVGLEVCCGGIFGLGESQRHRIELAVTLRDLEVDVVPMNFLHPIPGTPLEGREPMPPMEILKLIAVYRFMLPDKELKLAGGREKNLRDLQAMALLAGADSLLVGGYLTTPGRAADADLIMLKDLGLSWRETPAAFDGAGDP